MVKQIDLHIKNMESVNKLVNIIKFEEEGDSKKKKKKKEIGLVMKM